MKMILNKTRSSWKRFTLINGSMGCYGDPDYYPTYKYEVAEGVDRGNGYQGYMSVTYFLTQGSLDTSWIAPEAKENLVNFLRKEGYDRYLKEIGI